MLKVPPGHENPKTPLKSKRFINKVLFIGNARPVKKHDGNISCLRVTKDFIYTRRTAMPQGSGIYYNKGDSTRRVNCRMDGQQFADILIEDVFPSIRDKISWAKVVKVQWDNAGGHGVASLLAKIKTTSSPGAVERRAHDRAGFAVRAVA